MKTPLCCLPPLPSSFFKFCPTPSPRIPCHLQPPPQLFFLLSCFFGWMGDHATFDMLFYLMIIWIYICQALVPWYQKDLDVCFMQQGVRFWCRTYNVVFYWYWFDITNTQTPTAHSGASGLTHPCNRIFYHLLCAKSSYLIILNVTCCGKRDQPMFFPVDIM